MTNLKDGKIRIISENRGDIEAYLEDLGFKPQEDGDELHIFVDDIPFEIAGGDYPDPDEHLCDHYGLNYDLVDKIEYIEE